MPVQTSLFLPPNVFTANSSYAASLIGSSGSTSTLAIQCTAAASQDASSCGPAASTTTITVALTTFAMTTVSTAEHKTVTLTETCTMAPAISTAFCNMTADIGLFAPAYVDKAQYIANVLPVNITNVAKKPIATSTSAAAAIVQSKTLSVLM